MDRHRGTVSNYYFIFTELHEELEKIEDDVEFAYAILFMIRGLDYEGKIYTQYTRKLLENIRELGLGTYVEWADRLNDKKVFIAMSFHARMKKVREAIRDAVKASGYRPVWIDEKQYNGQIVSEIYKEIEESQFVIADLTQQKTGVYYEAGYAMGVKKPLIFCCKYAEREKLHFDVAQINTILWKDREDLKKRLVERIVVTINNGK